MKNLTEHISQYAAYHRDPRNVVTHFVGIPIILMAVVTLLSRPEWLVGGVSVSLGTAFVVVFSLFYLSLDRPLGLLMTLLMGLCAWFGHWAASQDTQTWLVIGVGGFVVGWIIQFIGHYYEGRKPAFVDDLIGLMVGPLFVVVELMFWLGLQPVLQAEVERRVGPLRRREMA